MPQWLVRSLVVTVLCALGGPVWSAPLLYWCPDRPADQRYSTTPEVGCLPLVEGTERTSLSAHPPVHPDVFLRNVSRFLERYRWVLDCCATDVNAIEAVKDLQQEAAGLLIALPPDLSISLMLARGITLSAVMTPVAQARADLRRIAQRLEDLRAAEERLSTADYFTGWNEHRRLRADLEAFVRDIGRPQWPVGPPTGMEIGVTPPHGPEIGVVPHTGPAIGAVPPTGPEIGVTPATGKEVGQTPATGSEIGATGRVGPDIGNAGR